MNLLAYPFYQWSAECLRPARAWAAATRATMSLWPPATSTPTGRMVDALCELLECCAFSHRRPPFGIASVVVDGETVPIVEEAATTTPFGTLLHFRKARPVARQPRVLIVAPMSGHFATLLRDAGA